MSSNVDIISLCVGGEHGCAVLSDKRMKCWGNKSALGIEVNGGLGTSMNELGDGLPYVNLGAGVLVEKVTCGFWHVCALLSSKNTKCFGWNDYYQTGNGLSIRYVGPGFGYGGDSLPVVNVGNGLDVIDVVGGQSHTCLIVSGNRIKCFGRNDASQLGYGHRNDIGKSPSEMGDSLPVVELGTGVDFSSLHVGTTSFHNCVILSAPAQAVQRIKCWGWGYYHQLGYGLGDVGGFPNQMGDNLPLVDLGSESRVKIVTPGKFYTCALLVNDNMKCWGTGTFGVLASGSSESISSNGNSIPIVLIDSGKKIKHLQSGGYHACIAYDDNLTMKCFGENTWGQLGQGDNLHRGDTPSTTIPNIPAINLGISHLTIKSIHIGQHFSCALFNDNSMKCFGANFSGQCLVGTNKGKIGAKISDMGENLMFSGLMLSTSMFTRSPTTAEHATLSPTTAEYVTLSPTTGFTEAPTSQEDDSAAGVVAGTVIGIVLSFSLFAIFIKKMRNKGPKYEDGIGIDNVQNNSQAQLSRIEYGRSNRKIADYDNSIAMASPINPDQLNQNNENIPLAIPIRSDEKKLFAEV